MTEFKPGDLIDSRYVVKGEIGRGGMGVVLCVEDRQANKEVALKYCQDNATLLDMDEQLRRFKREVRMMAGIQHENVMPVLASNLDYEPPYFVMPVADRSLAKEVSLGMNEIQALDVFKSICRGVQAVHSAGGTHRDIKPLNIMRMPDGRIVVSDLGLIKLDPRDSSTLTQTAQFIGTRVYCAPEQLLLAEVVGQMRGLMFTSSGKHYTN